MRTTHTLIFPFLLIFSVTQNAESQFDHIYETWRWSHFTASSGLPSDVVEEIIENKNGTIWASTLSGIAWYDGYRWNKIHDVQGLPEKHVTQLNAWKSNTLLVIVDGKLYSGDTAKFTQINLGSSFNSNVLSMAPIDSESIIVLTDNVQFPYLLISNNEIKPIQLTSTGRLFNTKNNDTYLAHAYGLYQIKNLEANKILSGCFIRTIADNADQSKVMIVDAPHDMMGIWEWNNTDVPKLSKTERFLPVRTIDISAKNNVVAVYETGEIHIRSNNRWSALYPLPQQMIGAIFVKFDSNDNLWVGTGKGLFLFKNQETKWKWFKHENFDLRDIVMEIFRDNNNNVWVGNSNGVTIYHKTGAIQEISHIGKTKLGLITGISQDLKGNIWISSGASFDGAYRWDGNSWKHFGSKEGLKSPRVHKIFKDRSGRLWFLGLGDNQGHDLNNNDPGAFVFENDSFRRYDTSNGILHNRVYSFAQSDNGALWFGTKLGLSKYANGKWKEFDKKVLKNISAVYAIAVDKENKLWFSNFSSQLGYIDVNDSVHWVWDWLPNADYRQKIWDVKIDSKGVVWVATTRGLYSYRDNNWSSYDYESEYKLRELRTVLPLDDSILVGGHGIGVGLLQRNQIGYSIKIKLHSPIVEPNKVHVRWNVDALWGAMPSDDIEIRYRLNLKEWSTWSSIKEVSFDNLTDGTYTFEIHAKDIYGNIQNKTSRIDFIVPPPIYKNPLYIGGYGILITAIIVLIIKNIKDRIEYLNNIKDQRIRISNDLHDDVGSNLGSISLISQRLARKVTDMPIIREDLTIIGDTAVQTAEELRDIVWYINPNNDTIIGVHRRLREIADRQLRGFDIHFQHSEIIGDDLSLLNIRRNILLTYKEILHNVMKHSRAKNVTITVNHQPGRFTITVADDGVGFDHTKEYSGNGMRSMRKRVAEARGQLTIDSNVGMGTTVTVVFAQYSGV